MHLAIETTGRLGSIAVLSGQRPLRQVNLDPTRRTASTLAPELEQTLRWCRQHDRLPKFVSVAAGPGSFTGLRIGVTTAKTLTYALDLPLIAVDSLAAIAAAALRVHSHIESISVVIDAYRGQVFEGTFSRQDLLPELDCVPVHWKTHPPSVRVLDSSQWESLRRELAPETALAGDLKPLGPRAKERVDRDCDAIGVGLLGIRAAVMGAFIDPLSLVPRYLRASAAEEKANLK